MASKGKDEITRTIIQSVAREGLCFKNDLKGRNIHHRYLKNKRNKCSPYQFCICKESEGKNGIPCASAIKGMKQLAAGIEQ